MSEPLKLSSRQRHSILKLIDNHQDKYKYLRRNGATAGVAVHYRIVGALNKLLAIADAYEREHENEYSGDKK